MLFLMAVRCHDLRFELIFPSCDNDATDIDRPAIGGKMQVCQTKNDYGFHLSALFYSGVGKDAF
jgi:hypothetical protein